MWVWMEKAVARKRWRHVLFWTTWVLGFTFIKSFGAPPEQYLGWFSYYIITLPLFMAHTYLVADVMIPRWMNQRSWPWLALGFLLAFCLFSIIELVVSNEFVYPWFETGQEVSKHYLDPANVVRNGLGNLYIVIVFIAGRTLRNWYYAEQEQKELLQSELRKHMEDARTKVQPMMLLYAIDRMDAMVEESSPDVTRAIALTSELLSEVMMYQEENKRWFSREIELVRKLIDLMNLLMGKDLDVEFFVSGDPSQVDLPPMILFSLVDLVYRSFGKQEDLPELHLEVSGFSSMLTLQLLHSGQEQKDSLEECMRTVSRLENMFGNRIFINYTKHPYGCSLVIGNRVRDEVNGVDGRKTAVDPSLHRIG